MMWFPRSDKAQLCCVIIVLLTCVSPSLQNTQTTATQQNQGNRFSNQQLEPFSELLGTYFKVVIDNSLKTDETIATLVNIITTLTNKFSVVEEEMKLMSDRYKNCEKQSRRVIKEDVKKFQDAIFQKINESDKNLKIYQDTAFEIINNIGGKLKNISDDLKLNSELEINKISVKITNISNQLHVYFDQESNSINEVKDHINLTNNQMSEKLGNISDNLKLSLKKDINEISVKMVNVSEQLNVYFEQEGNSIIEIENKLNLNNNQISEKMCNIIYSKLNLEQERNGVSLKMANFSDQLKVFIDQGKKSFIDISEKISNLGNNLTLKIDQEGNEKSTKLTYIRNQLLLEMKQDIITFNATTDMITLGNKEITVRIEDLYQDIHHNLTSLKEDILKVKRNTNSLGIMLILGCPEDEGFFMSPNTTECFKPILDKTYNWEGAAAKCKSEGLALANPKKPIELRKYLVSKYGGVNYWVGARGTGGTNFKWTLDGTTLSTNSSLIIPGSRDGSTDHCLGLLADSYNMDQHPTTPYISRHCKLSYYSICEVIMH